MIEVGTQIRQRPEGRMLAHEEGTRKKPDKRVETSTCVWSRKMGKKRSSCLRASKGEEGHLFEHLGADEGVKSVCMNASKRRVDSRQESQKEPVMAQSKNGVDAIAPKVRCVQRQEARERR